MHSLLHTTVVAVLLPVAAAQVTTSSAGTAHDIQKIVSRRNATQVIGNVAFDPA